MTTYFIIVNRATGDLYDGNNLSRFYDMATSAQGQANLNRYTILEVIIDGPVIKADQVAKYSRTELEFYAGIKETITENEERLNYLVEELEEDDLSRYEMEELNRAIKEEQVDIEMLQNLRYEDLAWK